MKLTIFFMAVAIFSASAATRSQTVSFKGKNVSLQEVFSAIEKQTGFAVFCNVDLLDNAHKVTIDVTNVPLKDFLGRVFNDQPLDYSIKNTTIVIARKSRVSNGTINVAGVDATLPLSLIRGRVVDADGAPLAGATVTLKGGQVLGLTNAEGVFSVNVSVGDVLVISSVGFEPTDYKISSAIVASSDQPSTPGTGVSLTISLKRKERQLDEVVVNKGYYTEKQRVQTGSVSSIKANEIENQPVSNPLLSMQGRMPGVLITQNTGVAGGTVKIQIRGQNSISNGSDPLYIVDGVPLNDQLLPSNGNSILQINNGSGGGNLLGFLNPYSIESISVLKDADATAIYGSRGANGVVLVTTKKGNAGKLKGNIKLTTGISKVAFKQHLMNTSQYLAMRREAFKNDGVIPDATNAPDLFIWDTTRYTDWQKKLIGGSAKYYNAQASISGGNDLSQYLISGNYNRQTTVFPGDFADSRGSLNFNLNENSSNKKFNATLSGSYVADDNRVPSVDISSSLNLPPNAPEVFNSDGSLNWANSTWTNPLSYTKQSFKLLSRNLIGSLRLSYQILNNLSVSTNFGYTNTKMNETYTVPIAAQNPLFSPVTGSSSFTDNNMESWIIEPQLKYNLVKGDSKLEFLAGSTFQQNVTNGQIIDVYGYTSDALLENIQAGPTKLFRVPVYTEYRYNAMFGRLNYNLRNTYIINLTGRKDGSSRFGDNNKIHNFGSVGLGWIFTEEKFIRNNLKWLSFGKINGSYGVAGSDQVGDYRYYDLFSPGQYSYQGTVPLTPLGHSNPNLEWEQTKKFEVALQLGFFNDRLLFGANYYDNRSSNQITSLGLPALTGFNLVSGNFPALVGNSGLEFSVTATNFSSKNFSWTTSINLTIPKNKLISYPDLANSQFASTLVIGQPLGIKKGFQFYGVNDTTGVYQFVDSKGNLTSIPNTSTDYTVLINTAPKFYGGINNEINYKNFRLSFFIQFTKKVGFDAGLFGGIFPPGFLMMNGSAEYLNRWQSIGDQTNIQKFTQSFSSQAISAYPYAAYSNKAYPDASFIRLKTLAVSYSLPDHLLKGLKLQNCRFYVNCENLFTISKYKNADPETNSVSVIPPLRFLTGGIEVTF